MPSLQTKDLCAAEAQTVAKHTVATLNKMRMDEHCHLIWENVKQKATNLDDNTPKLSRRKRAPAKIEEFSGGKAAPEYANDVIFQYRRICFEFLLFDQEDFRTYAKLENLLLKAA